MDSLPIQSPFPGAGCFRVPVTDSTMEEARRMAAAGFPEGSVIAADRQTAGRGRFRDRSWLSEPGRDLTFTIILPKSSAALPGLPLRAGLALHRAVLAYAAAEGLALRADLAVKWPNDLLAGGRKTAGMLLESSREGCFLGVGVNCAKPGDAPFRTPATGLSEVLGTAVDRFRLLEVFLSHLARVLEEAGWRGEVERRLWLRGERIRFRTGFADPGTQGSRTAEGVLRSLGENGELLLETDRGLEAFASGEILAIPADI